MNGLYYWHRDIHEHISGGKDGIKFGGGDMTMQDKDKMMELLDFAPWVEWGATPNNIPLADMKKKSSQTQMPCRKHKNVWMPASKCASQCRITSKTYRKKAS